MQENCGKSFFCPMDKKMIPNILHEVLESVLVCSSKVAHGTRVNYALSRGYLDFWDTLDCSHFMHNLCSGKAILNQTDKTNIPLTIT